MPARLPQTGRPTPSSAARPKASASDGARAPGAGGNPTWERLALGPIPSAAPAPGGRLTLGHPDDPLEGEARAMARRALHRSAGPPARPTAARAQSVQRQCSRCAEEDIVQPRPAGSAREPQGSGGGGGRLAGAIAAPGSGAPVAEDIRQRVEPILGADLGGVRVHDDPQAQAAAGEIHAQAFTHRNHIYLAAGQRGDDLGLMAHELTHTVQQGAVRAVPGQVVQRPAAPYVAARTTCEPPPNYHSKVLERLETIRKSRPAGAARLPALKSLAEEVPREERFCLHQRLSKTGKDAFTEYLRIHFPETRDAFLKAIDPTSPQPIEIDSGIPAGAYDDTVGECRQIDACEPTADAAPAAIPAATGTNAGGLEIEGPGWSAVGAPGIAFVEGGPGQGGANLRKGLDTGSDLIAWLPADSQVFVLKHHAQAKRYAVAAVQAGGGAFGYVADWLIATNLPDPEARLYKVKSGDTALGIAMAQYTGGEFNAWGKDARYLVNALSWVNRRHPHRIHGGPGIAKDDDDADWRSAVAYADAYTWIPGARHMDAIYGQVAAHGGGTGSIGADLWRGVKQIGEYAAYGVAFVGGLVHGFAKSIYDAVAGLVGLVADVLVSVFTGEAIKDAQELWKAISGVTWEGVKEAIGSWADGWLVKLNSDSPWISGHAHGYLTGYIMAEAAQLLLTAGTLAAVKSAAMATKIGKAIAASRAYRLLIVGVDTAATASAKSKTLFAKAGLALRRSKPFQSVRVARQWLIDAIGVSAKTAEDISLYAANRLRGLSDEVLEKLRGLTEELRRRLLGCHSPCDCDPAFVVAHIDDPAAAGKAAAMALHPPKGYKHVKLKSVADLPRDAAKNIEPLPPNLVYEFDGGHRIWRDPDGAIRHDSTIGESLGRAHLETELYGATAHGNPKYKGTERAHTLGQGTGFESPFGLYYAPREVNQTLQNSGIEMFLRQSAKALPSGTTLHAVTRTTPHTGSLLLKEIVYKVQLQDAAGKRSTLFDYAVSVADDAPNPTVSHGIVGVTDATAVQGLMSRVSGADNFKSLLHKFLAGE